MPAPILPRPPHFGHGWAIGGGAARLEVAIDREAEVTHKIATKSTLLRFEHAALLTMFEKS